MQTDWMLIRRQAMELSERFAGARVKDAGSLADGRFALQLWRRSGAELLAFAPFASPPLVTIEESALSLGDAPGFMRRAASALRATTLLNITTRTGDRLMRLTFGTRSRFGVESGYTLVAELVPRFGNLLLLKDETLVVALKEFSARKNAVRTIRAGTVYQPPPLDLNPRHTDGEAAALLSGIASTSPDAKEAARTLRAAFPLLPQLIADSIAHSDASPDQMIAQAADLAHRAEALCAEPLHVYRDREALVQAHVVALRQFADLHDTLGGELSPLFGEAFTQRVNAPHEDRALVQRAALRRALQEREARIERDLAALRARQTDEGIQESLRESGEALYATLHERPAEEREALKSEAAQTFTRYRKLRDAAPHLQARAKHFQDELIKIHELQWTLAAAAPEDLDDLSQEIDGGQRSVPRSPRKRRKRVPLKIVTPDGSRILVGRSPVENAELTFRVARPDDLWFHAQRTPGAHVILQRDDLRPPSEDDRRLAASLAAFYSKARESPRVTVDFTQRKYVRKRPGAAPGLVFYTQAQSLTVVPASAGTVASGLD